jgi:hypothetical protein
MALPPPEGRAVAVNGRDRSDGQPGLDPAHAGPLPQATLIELVGRLINDTSDLADRQIDLAKQEVAEAKDDVVVAVKRVAIGGGIAAVVALLLVIWAWTAFIWFFNWLFGHVSFPTPFGPQTLAWFGWLFGALVPAVGGYVAYRFIRQGIYEATAVWPPLPRTRNTLKEDLEWVRRLRTPRAR